MRPTMVFLTAIALSVVISAPASAAKLSKMDTPTLNCANVGQVTLDVLVCAGSNTGAPAGFSLQWVTAEQLANGPDGIAGTLDDNTWPSSDSLDLCKASFSGNANGSTYNLGKGQCASVDIGDNLFDNAGASSNCANVPLACGTTYAFRGFAHASSSLFRSNFTSELFCTTQQCDVSSNCTLTQGYWKTHGPVPTGNNSNEWAVGELTLGTVSYTDLQLQSIFDTPAGGNGLISLAHQLIAAKLNIANGADDTAVAGAIVAADALIGNLVVPPVGSGFLPPRSSSALTAALGAFNEGEIGPGHCE